MNRLPDDNTTQGDDAPWSEVPGPGFTGRPPDSNSLGQSLASIDLVTSDDFRTVADLNQHDTGRILNDLQAKGVITPFQRARLAEGRAEALQMDEYIIIDRIGVGGMGEVFKARNRSLDRVEAIKTMNAGYDPSSSVSQRFHREAKLLARIEHPSIVPIYKIGHALGVDYIAMKYIEGVNLKEKVDQATSMGQLITINQAVDWISQAASALAKAHEASIIHRDIKPGNLMLSPEGRLYILDLGIARLAEKNDGIASGITRQASAIGTPEFMPPEQWADATTVTPETDIYALGCTLFYLLTGRPPFIGDKLSDVMQGHTSQEPPSLSTFRSDVPSALEQILSKMLAKDPQDRIRQAKAVVDALRQVPLEPEMSTVARPVRRPVPLAAAPQTTRRKTSWVLLVPLIALTAGIGTASWWFSMHESIEIAEKPTSKTSAPQTKLVAPSPTDQTQETNRLPDQPSKTQTPSEPPPLPTWVERYAIENALEWGDSRDILEFAKQAHEGKSLDQLPDPIKEKLDAETTRRRESRVDTLMAELLASLPEDSRVAWPDRNELAGFVGSLKSFDSVSSIGDLHAVREAIEIESNRLAKPFEGLKLDQAGEEWARQWASSASKTLQQIMMLHATKPSIEGFEAKFLDAESRPVDKTTVKSPVTLTYKSTEPVYLTVVQWDDKGLTAFALSKENPASDRFRPISTTRFDFAGPKTLMIYATNRPYFSDNVTRIDGEQVPMTEVYSSRRTEPRIRKAFESGAALAGVGGPDEACRWTRSVVRLNVVEP